MPEMGGEGPVGAAGAPTPLGLTPGTSICDAFQNGEAKAAPRDASRERTGANREAAEKSWGYITVLEP
jgi:hypothetical protein